METWVTMSWQNSSFRACGRLAKARLTTIIDVGVIGTSFANHPLISRHFCEISSGYSRHRTVFALATDELKIFRIG